MANWRVTGDWDKDSKAQEDEKKKEKKKKERAVRLNERATGDWGHDTAVAEAQSRQAAKSSTWWEDYKRAQRFKIANRQLEKNRSRDAAEDEIRELFRNPFSSDAEWQAGVLQRNADRYKRDLTLYQEAMKNASTSGEYFSAHRQAVESQSAVKHQFERYQQAAQKAEQDRNESNLVNRPAQWQAENLTPQEIEQRLAYYRSEAATPTVTDRDREAHSYLYPEAALQKVPHGARFDERLLEGAGQDAIDALYRPILTEQEKAAVEEADRQIIEEKSKSNYENVQRLLAAQAGQTEAASRARGNELIDEIAQGGEAANKAKTGKALFEQQQKKIDEESPTIIYGMHGNYSAAMAERTKRGYILGSDWDNVPEDRKQAVYALYTESPEKALELAKFYIADVRQAEDEEKQAWYAQNGWTAALGLVSSAAAHLGAAVDPFGDVGQELTRRGDNALAGGSQWADAATGYQKIPEWVPIVGGKGAGDFYQTVGSVVQSAAVAAPAILVGRYDKAAAETIGKLGLVLMGSSAAASDYRESVAAGMDEDRAKLHALAAGVEEALFEEVSLDKLIKMDTSGGLKAALKNWLVQSGIEGSEELATSIANRITDEMISGAGQSKVERRASELIANGMNSTEAHTQAESEWMTDTLYEGFSGFLSGGMMTGGNYALKGLANLKERAVNAAETRKAQKQAGAAVSRSEGSVEALQAYAKDNGIEIKSVETAEQSAEQGGQKADQNSYSASDYRSISDTNSKVTQSIRNEVRGKTVQEQQTIRDSLVEKYGDGIAPAVYNAISLETASRVRQEYGDVDSIQAARNQAISEIKDESLRRAVSDGYDSAAYSLAASQGGEGGMNTMSRYIQQRNNTGTGEMSMNATVTAQDGSTKTISITGMSEDGKRVSLADGSEVAVKDLQADADTTSAIQQLADLDLGADATKVLQAYQQSGVAGTEGYRWLMDYATAYNQGRTRQISLEQAAQRSSLDGRTVMDAYTLGQQSANRETLAGLEKLKNLPKRKGASGKTANIDTTEIKGKTMSKSELEQFALANQYAQALGVDMKWFSSKEKDGKFVGKNGAYENGKIYMDIHAGRNFAADLTSGILATMGHELSHFEQQYAPEEYQALKEFLFEQIVKSSPNGEARLERLIWEKQRRSGNTLSRKAAEDEVVADACQKMLRDSKAVHDFASQQPEAANGVIRWLDKWFKKVRSIFGRGGNYSEEAQIMDSLEQDVKAAFGELWDKALKQAVQVHDEVGNIGASTIRGIEETGASEQMAEEAVVQNSDRLDDETLRFLDNQEHVTVYRAMQMIDGKLYPPMAAKVEGKLVDATELGEWYQAVERPDLIDPKTGKWKLDKANGKAIKAAYNPYFHTSATPLNDQFSSAYKRPNIVVVEGIIPKSELTSGYKAQYAKDPVGETKWHAGPVASKLKGAKSRRVFLSRWFQAQRVVSDAEVADVVAKTLEGENIAVPNNVVTPSLLEALRERGVAIDEDAINRFESKHGMRQNSDRDTEYLELSKDPEKNAAKLQEMVDEAAKRAGYTYEVWHGTNEGDFTVFDWGKTQRADAGWYGRGHYFATHKGEASAYGERVIHSYLRIKNPFNFQNELLDVNGQRLPVGAQSLRFMQTMGALDPEYFGNRILEAYDNWTDQDKRIKWADIGKEIDTILNGMKLRKYADGHCEWAYDYGGWSEESTKNEYATQEAAEKAKEAAAYELLQKRFNTRLPLDPAAYYLGGDMKASNKFSEVLKKKGYDGVLQGTNGDEIVVFDSPQIKSADPVTYDDQGNVIPLSKRFNEANEDIRFSERDNAKPRSAQAQRDAGYKLSETKFYSLYSAHKLNMTGEGNVQEQISSIMADGFKGDGGFGNNVMPTNISYDVDENGKRIPRGLSAQKYAPKKSEYILLVPKEGVEVKGGRYNFTERVKPGYKPAFDYEIVQADYDGQPYYEMYEKAYDKSQAEKADVTLDGAQFSERDYSAPSDEELLDTVQSTELNDTEQKRLLTEYQTLRRQIKSMEKRLETLEENRAKLNEKIQGGKEYSEKYVSIKDKEIENLRREIETSREYLQEKMLTPKLADLLKAQRRNAAAKAKQQKEAQFARYKEDKKAGELRRRITRHSKELYGKLTKPSDKRHIPEAYRGAVAALLNTINLESAYDIQEGTKNESGRGGKHVEKGTGTATNRTKAFQEVRKQLEKVLAEGGFTGELINNAADGFDGGLIEKCQDFADKPISTLSSEELETLWNTIRALEHNIATFNKAFALAKNETISGLADSFLASAQKRKPLLKDPKSRLDLKIKKTSGAAMKALENPYTFFSHYGEEGIKLYRALRDTQDLEIVRTNNLSDLWVRKMADILGDEKTAKLNGDELTNAILDKIRDTSKQMDEKVETFKLENGQTITLTHAMLMDVYLLAQRGEVGMNHLLGSGLIQPEIRAKGKYVARDPSFRKLSLQDVQKLTGVITENATEKAIADAIQSMQHQLADWGNKASMDVFGYRKFTEDNYWPVKNAKEENKSDSGKGGNQPANVMNKGMAKNLVPNAATGMEPMSAFTKLQGSISDMLMYATWGPVMEDFKRFYNWKWLNPNGGTSDTVKGVMERYGGEGSQRYWEELRDQINNGIGNGKNIVDQFIGKAVGAVKGARVAYNLRVVVQQPTAYARAAEVISGKYLAASLLDIKSWGWKAKSAWNRALTHSPIAMRKDSTIYDMGGNISVGGEFGLDRPGRLDKAREFGTALAGKADAITWGRLWHAAELQVSAKTNLEYGSQEYWNAVNKLFTEAVDRTQVVDGLLQRPAIMRTDSDFVKGATSYMGEPLMQLNMLMRQVNDFRQTGFKATKKQIGKTVTALVVTQLFNAMLTGLYDAGIRKDDEDKDFWERFVAEITGLDGTEENAWDYITSIWLESNTTSEMSVMQKIPLLKDVLSMLQGYDPSNNRMDLEAVKDLIDVCTKVLWNDKYTPLHKAKEIINKSSMIFGAGFGNALKDMYGVTRNIVNDFGKPKARFDFKALWLNPASEKNKSQYFDLLFQMLENGDKDAFRQRAKKLAGQDGMLEFVAKAAIERYLTDGLSPADVWDMMEAARDDGMSDEKFFEYAHGRMTDAFKKRYFNHNLDDDHAITLLMQYSGKNEKGAWNTVRKWKDQTKHVGADGKLPDDYKWNQYDDLDEAVANGEDVTGLLTEYRNRGYTETQINGALRDSIQEAMASGDLNEDEAADALIRYGVTYSKDGKTVVYDKQSAWKKVQEWADKAEHTDEEGEPEDGYKYSVYSDLFDAVDANQDAEKVIKEMVQNGGYEADSLRGKIKEHLRERFIAGEITETALKNQLSRYCKIVNTNDVNEIVANAKCKRDFGVFPDGLKEAFKDGDLSQNQAEKALQQYNGLSKTDAQNRVRYWGYDGDLSENAWLKWNKDLKGSGLSVENWEKVSKVKNNAKGTDANGDGKADYGTAKAEVVSYIDSMNIPKSQKKAIYLAFGWAASTMPNWR